MAIEAARQLEHSRNDAAGVEPETVLPSQFFTGVHIDASLQPEKRLMLAVLEEAVGTYQKCSLASGRRARRLASDVEEWFASDDTVWPFSFVSICQALALEPQYIRGGLRRWRERQEARGQETSILLRFPFRRVNGRRHSVTGRAIGLRHSA
jgi:hypothetical protein